MATLLDTEFGVQPNPSFFLQMESEQSSTYTCAGGNGECADCNQPAGSEFAEGTDELTAQGNACNNHEPDDENASCNFAYNTASSQWECSSMTVYDATQYSFTPETEPANVFTNIVKELRTRRSDLNKALLALRNNEQTCKERLFQHSQILRSAVLQWDEYFSRFNTAHVEWHAADTSAADAAGKVQTVQNQISTMGLRHAKVQKEYKERMDKWMKGERALSYAIAQLRRVGGDFAGTVKLIDAVRDRIIRQQAQATDDIEAEHSEYKTLLRATMATLNTLEAEQNNALTIVAIESDKMNSMWDQIQFADSSGIAQEPSLSDANALDTWVVDSNNRLSLETETNIPNMIMDTNAGGANQGGRDTAEDGTQTSQVWDDALEVISFDNCTTVQIATLIQDENGNYEYTPDGLLYDAGWTVQDSRDSQSSLTGGNHGTWKGDDGSSGTLTGNAMTLYQEQNDKTWIDARNAIQAQIDQATNLIGMLSRFSFGSAATSDIIAPTPYGGGAR